MAKRLTHDLLRRHSRLRSRWLPGAALSVALAAWLPTAVLAQEATTVPSAENKSGQAEGEGGGAGFLPEGVVERAAFGGEADEPPARMRAIDHACARQCRDRHRAFGLTINLHEARTERINSLAYIRDIHRPAAIDHRLYSLAAIAAQFSLRNHPANHGRRGKHTHIAQTRRYLLDLGGIEAARLRHNMARRADREHEIVAPRTMRHRRRIKNAIIGLNLINIDKVIQRHGLNVAVSLHHAFGAPGRA